MNNRNDRPGRNYNDNYQQTRSPQNTVRDPRQMRQSGQRPVQRPSQTRRPQSDEEKSGSNVIIVIEVFLLIFAIAAAVMFCSFLKTDFHFRYVETVKPSTVKTGLSDEPEEKIYEREIPQKPESPVTEKLEYDFKNPVPECDAYPLDYFNDTLFIGDSRTAGLIMYTKLSPIDCSATGFNLNNLNAKKYITYVDENGKKSSVTCYEALELYKGRYKSIYISTGVNELGWNVSMFAKAYKKAIESIREITDVPIYVQLILPVTTAYERKSENGITNEKQVQFNEKLRELIEEEQVFMLDPLSLFSLEDGTLDPEKTYDGAHLEKFACKELLEYYQTHVVEVGKYSNLTGDGVSVDA